MRTCVCKLERMFVPQLTAHVARVYVAAAPLHSPAALQPAHCVDWSAHPLVGTTGAGVYTTGVYGTGVYTGAVYGTGVYTTGVYGVAVATTALHVPGCKCVRASVCACIRV